MSQKQATEPVGEGTPGTRVKAAWRRASGGMPLRAWARAEAVREDDGKLRSDAREWLASKRSGGTDEQRKERKLRIRERRSANAAARLTRRAQKANGGQQKKKEGQGR